MNTMKTKSVKVRAGSADSNIRQMMLHAKKMYEQENYEESTMCYRRILCDDPLNVQVQCYLAQVLIQQGDLEAAYKTALTALRINPKIEKTYLIAAKALERMGNTEMCAHILMEGMGNCEPSKKLEAFFQSSK